MKRAILGGLVLGALVVAIPLVWIVLRAEAALWDALDPQDARERGAL